MRATFSGLLVAAMIAAFLIFPVSCGEDTCRVEISAPESGDPIQVRVCSTCNKGKDPQEAETIEIVFLPNATDVGCRCIGATCVICTDECTDSECDVELVTEESDGCTSPAISLELDEEDFEDGVRIPVTIHATSRFGESTSVVNLVRATPTPTPTTTPTLTPTPTPTITQTPTQTPLLG